MCDCQCPKCASNFTKREREVCSFLASGLPQSQVAAQLTVSVATIRYHERQIRHKINVQTRTLAAIKLRSLGFG